MTWTYSSFNGWYECLCGFRTTNPDLGVSKRHVAACPHWVIANSEPIYQFIKGQGWVPRPGVASLSREVVHPQYLTKHRVTVYERWPDPDKGEYGWYVIRPESTLEDLLNEIGYSGGWPATHDEMEFASRNPNQRIVTVVLEDL